MVRKIKIIIQQMSNIHCKVKLEKWTRIDPTSPGIMANSN